MPTKTLIASFDSRKRTASAQSRLHRAGVPPQDIEVEEMTLNSRNLFKVRAVVEESESRPAVDALWDAGALEVEQRREQRQTDGWFGGEQAGL